MLECAAAEEKAFIQLFTGEAAMHKKVWALKIKTVTVGDFGHDVLLTFEDWYFVQYEDGYISFSPADQFEKGNTHPKTFQDRVEVEKAELDEKISKLHTFLNTSVFADLDHEEQDRLNEQITAQPSNPAPRRTTHRRCKMKRTLILTALGIGLCAAVGCQYASAPLPPHAINATDSNVNHVLQMAHSGAAQFDADVVSGKFVPTAAQKSAYNSISKALNVADPLYRQWHAALVANPGAGEPQQLIDAAAIVTANINTILTAVGKVK